MNQLRRSFLLFIIICCVEMDPMEGCHFPHPTQLPPGGADHTCSDAQVAITAYLGGYEERRFRLNVRLTSKASRRQPPKISPNATRHLNNMAREPEYEVLPPGHTVSAESVSRITYHTLMGNQREILMRLTNEDGEWRVQWEDGLILPELAGAINSMDCSTSRGNIYDIRSLVAQTDAFAGIIPDKSSLIRRNPGGELSRLCGYTVEGIRRDRRAGLTGTGMWRRGRSGALAES
jgi:penicillin-binding protein 2